MFDTFATVIVPAVEQFVSITPGCVTLLADSAAIAQTQNVIVGQNEDIRAACELTTRVFHRSKIRAPE